MKHAREAVEDFFQIPIAISEDLIYDLADGLEQIFRDYTAFTASCGKNHFLMFFGFPFAYSICYLV